MSPFGFIFVEFGERGRNCAVYDLGPVSRKGPVIGSVDGHAIHAWVHDVTDRRFEYAGVAPRLSSGDLDLQALRPGEMIYEGELVYVPCDRAPGLDRPARSARME